MPFNPRVLRVCRQKMVHFFPFFFFFFRVLWKRGALSLSRLRRILFWSTPGDLLRGRDEATDGRGERLDALAAVDLPPKVQVPLI